jgi:hypothetical protein
VFHLESQVNITQIRDSFLHFSLLLSSKAKKSAKDAKIYYRPDGLKLSDRYQPKKWKYYEKVDILFATYVAAIYGNESGDFKKNKY